ncbi:MAG: 5'-nucleotidase C-terminal domain-containing protein [Gemmatimonadota bacterium]
MPSPIAALAAALLLMQQPRPGARVPAARSAAADTTTIVIVATTDVHGRAMNWDYERDREAPLGLVRAATVIDSLRRRYPDRVVLVDAGDLIQGSPFATYFARISPQPVHPIIDVMNRMRYDAATLGNHDFNFGLGVMARAIVQARFLYLSANIQRANGQPLADTYTMVTRGGVQIGITGATTPGVLVWDGPAVLGQLRFLDVAQAVPPVVRQMRTDGADVTVLVAHAGLDGASSYGDLPDVPPENDVAAALAASPGLDVAIIGHTHREIADSTVGTTLVVQPKFWAQSVAVVRLSMARRAGRWQIVRKTGELIPLATVRPDSALVRALQPAHDSARAWATRPLGQSAAAMSARTARLEDTPVIDFINEVERQHTGADLASTAAFSTDGGIPSGAVRMADLSSIYPYDNTLRVVKLSGGDLRAYLEQTSRYYRGLGPDGPIVNDSVPGYNFDIVSGAEYELDISRPVGQRVRILRVNGRDVADTDSFTLALNNYRQQGGGGFPMIARAPVVYDRNESIRDLLAAAVQRQGTIRPEDYFTRNWSLTGVRPSRDSVVLRVLMTNDVHGALLPKVQSWSVGRPVGGAAAIAGMMNRLAAECGCPTIRLDGGDVMQGTPISNLTYGRSSVDAFNAMGYAAAAVGNHEFDWSVDTLAARAAQARFAWLSANIREAATGAVPRWTAPWRMVNAGPLRIAVVGYTTASPPTTTRPQNVASLRFDDGVRRVDSVIAAARGEAPDFVIVVAHSGAFCGRDTACEGEIVDLANALQNHPDLIVAGHTHALVGTIANGIPIIEARSSGSAIGIVDFVVQAGSRVAQLRSETVWTDQEQPDTTVARVVEGYRRQTDRLTNRSIVALQVPLLRRGDQYALGNLIADAFRAAAHADVAIENNGGIRSDLPAGAVNWGAMFEVMPFQNFVVRVPVTGVVLRQALEHAAGGGDARAHVSGVRVRVDPRAPEGRRVTSITLENGRPIEDSTHYVLAVPDFMASGGSGYAMLRGLPAENTGVVDLDAFIDYLRQLPQPIRVVPSEPRVDDGTAPERAPADDPAAPSRRRRRP